MDIQSIDVDLVIAFFGALIGSAKASVELNKNKRGVARCIDVILGVFCGFMLAYHFHNDNSTTLCGILALVGGVSGSIVVEVFMQMLPSIAKKAIKTAVDKTIK